LPSIDRGFFRRWLYVVLGVLAIGAVVAWRIANPRATVVVMTTGTTGSAYQAFAQRYKEILARAGVDLRLMPSAGSVENLQRLNDPRSGVAIGFSQGGLTDAKQSADLVSLGTVFYEPFWFFCRGAGCSSHAETLRSGKVALGPEGSGTRALALRLFALNGIERSTADVLPLNAAESAEALLRGEIDAAAMAASWDTPAVRKLLAAADTELISFPRANAYVALYPYLNKLVVPAGVGSLADNRPPTDVNLLAVKASLIVRRDMDTALQSVLLDAATQIHSGADLFQHAGQFPAPEAGDLPVSEDAYEFYKSGRPFLLRYLPFGLAILARKLLIVLVPLLGVVYPVVRFAPALYGWSMRRRVYRLYGELKLIEADLDARRGDSAALLQRLDHLEERADHLQVPLAFAQILYNMRSHIGLARARLQPVAAQRRPPSS
jgi:TRAP transporter TAXI family solute receptor